MSSRRQSASAGPAPARLLIVNADDYGLTEKVSRAILKAHRGGIVTSTSVLTLAPGFESTVGWLHSAPRLGTGAHLAAVGLKIAKLDPDVEQARTADRDVFYWLGFDIATGIFGDPKLGALGNTATGPGSLKIRDSLDAVARTGFNDAVTFHLNRAY